MRISDWSSDVCSSDLAAVDPDIGACYRRCGLPAERGSEPGFAGLIRMIAGQQVSVQSARAIIARLEARVVPLTAAAFLKARDDDLRAVGFRRPKMAYDQIGRATACNHVTNAHLVIS